VSLEQLRRRAHLLGELRFAATLQDMRSVIVLHRELAQDLPRSRPWWSVGAGRGSPSWQRDWRGIARWPVSRMLRVVTLSAVAGLICAGVWNGTYALVIVGGVVVFVIGIDAVEGLAQETDHPVLPRQYPVRWGDLALAHLVAPSVLLIGLGVIGGLVFWLVSGETVVLAVAGLMLVPLALAGTAGAALSVLLGAPPPTLFLDVGFPEFTTLFLIIRQTVAPLVVIAAFAPAAAASYASTNGGSPAGAALIALLLPLVLVVTATTFFRSRRTVNA
jgi:hypothetical protein